MVKMENVKLNREIGKINTRSILIGTTVSMVLSVIFLLIFSIILVNTNVKETLIKPVVIVVAAISILIGSSISTIKIKKNGILHGAIIGAVYIGIIYILSSLLLTGFGLNLSSIIMIISAIATGMLGRNNRSKYSLIKISRFLLKTVDIFFFLI